MAESQSPIRVAFLGADESTPELLRAVLDDARFELAGLCEFEERDAPAELRSIAAQLRSIPHWESLLDNQRIDAVIVARGPNEDLRAEQLRKLLQIEKPALVAHPVVRSMLIYYELDMIRRETDSVIVPYLPERKHPAIQTLARIVQQGAESPIGKVEHLSIERSIPSPTKENVERQFARDADLARAIAGDMTRLGAMAGSADAAGYASLGVQMSGPQAVAARWTVVPIASDQAAKITLTGSRGRAVIEGIGGGGDWRLALLTDGSPQNHTFDGWVAAEVALDQLVDAISGRAGSPDWPSPNWIDASRAIELAETIDRSLKKSRTVELYYEDYTEDATFKGTMTSLGCGLLILTVFLLALVGIGEQMKIPHLGIWRYLLVAILAVFLVAQLIMLTSGKSKESRQSEPPLSS